VPIPSVPACRPTRAGRTAAINSQQACREMNWLLEATLGSVSSWRISSGKLCRRSVRSRAYRAKSLLPAPGSDIPLTAPTSPFTRRSLHIFLTAQKPCRPSIKIPFNVVARRFRFKRDQSDLLHLRMVRPGQLGGPRPGVLSQPFIPVCDDSDSPRDCHGPVSTTRCSRHQVARQRGTGWAPRWRSHGRTTTGVPWTLAGKCCDGAGLPAFSTRNDSGWSSATRLTGVSAQRN
jgi:hypothetical protein